MNQQLHRATMRFFSKAFCCIALLLCSLAGYLHAQTTLSTNTVFTNDTTVSLVTFNFQNTNTYPVVITNIEGMVSDYGQLLTELWYKSTAINGAPGIINAANGWTQASAANIIGLPNTGNNTTTQPLFNPLTLSIPANTTYAMAVAVYSGGAGRLRIGYSPATVSVNAGGCNFLSGTNIGYSSYNVSPTSPTTALSGFLGKITFINGTACTGTPNVPVISGPASVCQGSMFNITAAGYSVASGITYNWQQYNTTTLAWVDIGSATNTTYTSSGITTATQYRLKTTCAGNSSYSNAITVNTNTGGFPGGTYTVNQNAPSSSSNFISFAAAISAMNCGLMGPVTFNVVAGSGPYNEAPHFIDVPGTSAVNTIRINGHSEVVQSFATLSTDPGVITIDHTDYLTIDSLTVRSLSPDIAIGVLFTDSSRNDTLTHCFVDVRSLNSNSNLYNTTGISLNSYYGNGNIYGRSKKVYIGYNYVLGTNGVGGPYYGIDAGGNNYLVNGNYADDTGNIIDHNMVENFTYCGIISQGSNGITITNNDIHRTNKINGDNFFGIISWMGYYNYAYADTITNKVKITGNRIHNPSISPTSSYVAYGIEAGQGWTGVYDQGSTDVLIANNAIYNFESYSNCTTYGIYYFGNDNYYNDSSNNDVAKIYHNTISMTQNMAGAIPGSDIAGIVDYDYYYLNYQDSNTLYVRNNLVTINGSSTSDKHGFIYNAYTASGSNNNDNILSQRNNYYVPSSVSGQFYGANYNIDYPTLASYQAAYPGQEVGSLSVDPAYLSEATGDLSPTNNLLFGNGVNVLSDVSVDILGRLRSATPTPGAFEVGIDFGVSALAGPLGTFCSSIKMVSVVIQNFGMINGIGATVNWSLNGVLQPSVSYTGTLAPNGTAVVNLGNGLFMPSTPVTIKAWTTNPGGQSDANHLNDTLTITTQSSTSVPVNIGSDDSICTGTTLTLDAGFPGSQYVWDNSTYNQQRTIQNAGTYYVKVTAFDGCIGVDTMKLSLRPLPIVNLGPQKAICEGSTTTLDAGNPGATYLWDDGSTQQTRTVDTAGQYEAHVTDQFGCTGTGDVIIIMKDLPSVEGINATHADSGLYTFYPLNPMYTNQYKWNFGDGSPEADGYMVQHAYVHNGIYYVTLFLTGECTGLVIQNTRTVDVFNAPADSGHGTGINNTAIGSAINVYPNPTTDLLQIDNKSEAKLNRVVVYTAVGQMLLDQKADNIKHHQLSTTGFANGLYSIRIETDKGTFVQKFEVVR